ncbi:MAG: hypothetical protein CM1200mP34_1850 [Verrucomicrobiales bacterium]|nr:MAG: hypothetical protein CM1200mP34_1850 [Verrucomicrobiales bacterium]
MPEVPGPNARFAGARYALPSSAGSVGSSTPGRRSNVSSERSSGIFSDLASLASSRRYALAWISLMALEAARFAPDRRSVTLPFTRPRETEARTMSRNSDSPDSSSAGTPSVTSACLRFTVFNSTTICAPLECILPVRIRSSISSYHSLLPEAGIVGIHPLTDIAVADVPL